MRVLINFMIVVFICLPKNSNAQVSVEDKSVQLSIISISWSGKEWKNPVSDTTYIEVNLGENFGAGNAPHYFKLVDIPDSNTIRVEFTDDLVVAGEPIAVPSKKNPVNILSGESTCFRTRLYDGGTDYCIFFH